ncbi:hypothetical protein VTI74DRAFT_6097 [Chaetomium olivicolor]
MPTPRPGERQSQAPAAALSSSHSTSGSTAVPSSTGSSNLKKRVTRSTKNEQRADEMSLPDEERPLLGSLAPEEAEAAVESLSWAKRNQWILFALASGACAAFNGVFAKLTTTELTAKFSGAIARMLGIGHAEGTIEFLVRGTFFGLNLAFNGVMWTFFTTALAKGNSTTQISIMNTSSNFFITAILGLVIFSESLPPLWWLGAAMLVAGNVIIGRKDERAENEKAGGADRGGSEGLVSQPGHSYVAGEEEEKGEDVAGLRL